MVPLVGYDVYAEMRAANAWANDFLPQAQGRRRLEPEPRMRGGRPLVQRFGEWLLGGRLGDALERWERDRKLRKFAAAAALAGSAAELDADRVKGHFDDHGSPILRKFRERVALHLGDENLAHITSPSMVEVVDSAD